MAINFESDSEQQTLTQDQLTNIAQLASAVVGSEKIVADIEAKLKIAKANLRQVQERDLPEAMLACNMEKFTTSDGLNVSVSETLYASVAKKNKAEAAKWLIDNELGALVKEDVVIGFDGGASEQVQALLTMLAENSINNVTTSESMNTASIKAAIKELLANGVDVPLELFGAHFARKAVVK